MTAETALCIVLIALVPCVGAGLALVNAGLGRSRSAAHTLLACMLAIAAAAIAYFAIGFSWQGFAGAPAHVLTINGKPWNLLAAEPLFFRGLRWDGSVATLVVLLQVMSVGIAAIIPVGAGSDRWRLGAIAMSTVSLAVCTYPLFAHWVWAGGWLAQLGANYGLGRGYADAGGAGPIHMLGGLTALSMAWILGPRRGKVTPEGMPAAIPGHNAVLVLLGCVLAMIGWLGLNAAGAIVLNGVAAEQAPRIMINTFLAAAAAALASAATTRVRFGKSDASLTANGWVGGLVSVSAACAWMTPAEAVLVAAAAGVLVPLAVEFIEVHLGIDDPGGAISVHGVVGAWGVIAAGWFGPREPGQWIAQLTGLATLLGFVLPLTYGLNLLLNRVYRQRVAIEGERQGMDLYELGAGAYPDFVTHGDEFLQR